MKNEWRSILCIRASTSRSFRQPVSSQQQKSNGNKKSIHCAYEIIDENFQLKNHLYAYRLYHRYETITINFG